MKYRKPMTQSYATQSKIEQNALMESKVFEQAINVMGDTIENMDKEKEQKHGIFRKKVG